MLIELSRAGIAGKSAALLKASKNCAKQSISNSTDLRVDESRSGGLSQSVSTDETGKSDNMVGHGVLPEEKLQQKGALAGGGNVYFLLG